MAITEESTGTGVLERLRDHRRASLDDLVPVVYEELRRIAHRQLAAREDIGGTLQTTALVHEAYLKLVDQSRAEWTDRAHFLALAALAMRHVLADRAKAQRAAKRGGAPRPITLDELALRVDEQAETVLQIHDALERLATIDTRLARVVELRFYGGMTNDEIAAVLEVTPRTVERDWTKARMLLREALVL